MREYFDRYGLHASVILICLASCAMLWMALIEEFKSERGRIIASQLQENDNLARVFEEHVARTIRAAEVTLQDIASEYRRYGRQFDLVQYAADRRSYLDPYTILSIADENGEPVMGTVPQTKPVNFRNYENNLYHARNDTQQLYFGKPRFGASTGKWTMHLSIRINKLDGSFGGVAVLGMDPGYFSKTYTALDLGKDAIVSLVGRDGIIRARNTGMDLTAGQDVSNSELIIKLLPAADHGNFIRESYVDKVTRINSYRALKDYPLVVVIGTSQAVTLADYDKRRAVYLPAASAMTSFILCLGFFALFQIKKSKEAETTLTANEELMRTTFEQAPVGVVHTALDRRYLRVNQKFCDMVGYSREELLSMRSVTLAHPDDPAEENANQKELLAGRLKIYAAEKRYVRKDGTVIWVNRTVSLARDNAGNPSYFIRIIEDISQRKEAEDRFLATFEQAAVGIAHIAVGSYRMLLVNRKFCELLGYTQDELTGTDSRVLTAPDELAAREAERARVLAGAIRTSSSERQLIKKDGKLLWVNRSLSLVRNPAGQPNYFISVIEDISERKHAEAARTSLETQLREAQKMQAIGTLAGGIAHDFNNIIATILGNTDLARQDASANPAALESLNEIRKAGMRARDLVQQILAFSRRQPAERKPLALAPLVEDAVRLLRATLPARVSLQVYCEPGVPLVRADATLIQQALINLATNAAQSMQGQSGRISIRLDTVTLDAALVQVCPLLREMHAKHPGRTVRLAVSDDGQGMDAATQERIFEPFFTTKPAGEGTGLGLSVVHGIVQTHEGAIVVQSHPGQGATFALYLPLAGESTEVPMADERIMTPTRALILDGGQHILYLDDDDALVYLVRRLLERRRYRVSAYTDQNEALAALRADPDDFDLVVTDYNMPGMSGLDVAREVRAIRADLPVAVTSGFIDETLRTQAAGVGVRELIFKADAVEVYCATIQRLMDTVAENSETC